MLKRFLILGAICFVGLLSGCSTSQKNLIDVGSVAPSTKFKLLDSSYLLLDEMRGKTFVVMFWAAWCSRSRQEIVGYNALAKKLKGRSDVSFLVASVDALEDLEKVRTRLEDEGIHSVPVAFSGNEGYDEAYIAFGSEPLPTYFVIDSKGAVVAKGRSLSVVEESFKTLGILAH